MRFLFKNNLSVKLLRIVFAIYLIITLCVTLIQISVEYWRINEDIIESLQAVEAIFKENLTHAAWAFDSGQLQAILTGIMKMPVIVGIKISGMDKPPDWKGAFPIRLGTVLNENREIINITLQGETRNDHPYLKLIPHRFSLRENGLLLGEVILYSSERIVLEKVKYSLLSIVVAACIKTAVLWILFIWAFDKYLGKQLNHFCATMEKSGFDIFANDYLKLQTHNIDELTRIERVYNQMLWRIKEARNSLDRLNANLERQVIQRTAEIQTKNAKLELLNQEKNDFLSIAAHNLRNPLSNIASLSFLIEKGVQSTPNKETLSHYNALIGANSRNMLEVIDNLLDVNKIEAGGLQVELSEVNVGLLLETIISRYSLHAESKNIRIGYKTKNNDYTIISDEFKLSQILDNLVSNAIKYTPPGKEVSLIVARQPDFIQVEIQNQGQGFSLADKERLFTKFARLSGKPTANESSSGLGLYIVKKLADFLDIAVDVESAETAGATFILKIPLTLNQNNRPRPA